ncbi:MAG: hypothetical protein D3925_02900 [Candidatus Electrothrix sp. AR5]|nr:hypothetical protein [Candidatus Electrothrix sp. AR5]
MSASHPKIKPHSDASYRSGSRARIPAAKNEKEGHRHKLATLFLFTSERRPFGRSKTAKSPKNGFGGPLKGVFCANGATQSVSFSLFPSEVVSVGHFSRPLTPSLWKIIRCHNSMFKKWALTNIAKEDYELECCFKDKGSAEHLPLYNQKSGKSERGTKPDKKALNLAAELEIQLAFSIRECHSVPEHPGRQQLGS